MIAWGGHLAVAAPCTTKDLMHNKFLHAVWSRQEGDYAFTSTKNWDTGAWKDYPCNPRGSVVLASDLYFAPCLFSGNRRLRRDACGGRWLYADLDSVDPRTLASLAVAPTLAWETSPGRFQALWLLDRVVAPRSLEKLNRRLTYFTGADKGGWSLTKVLRVPGSVSTKRDEPFTVRLLRDLPRVTHTYHDLNELLRDVNVDGHSSNDAERPDARDLPDRDSVLRRRRRSLTVRARQLVRSTEVIGTDDRSRRLWELEYELLASGLTPAEVLSVVRHTPWNKYAGQRRELDMLWKEITRQDANKATGPHLTRAQKRRVDKKVVEEAPFHPIGFRDFITSSLPRTSWLVEGIWSGKAHGLLGGESKSFKSLLTYDLAVSVASATPFLGRFAVPKAGPVLIIQEENTAGDARDLILRIASSRGIGPKVVVGSDDPGSTTLDMGEDLPIDIVNNGGFSFVDDSHWRWLESYIRKTRPVLCVFDPLYLVTPGINEDSAVEMTPILSRLLRLKQKYGTGMMIVHHYKKATDAKPKRAAERMSGTGVFHRWLASAVYVERPDESLPVVRLSGEHRSQASAGAFSVTFDLGTDEDLHYSAAVETWRDKKPKEVEDLFELGVAVQIDENTEVKIPAFNESTKVLHLAKAAGVTANEMTMALRMCDFVVRADGEEYGTSGKRHRIAYPKGME